MNATWIGKRIEELPTPCLLIDRLALNTNLARMQQCAAGAGKALRAHAKSHKCSTLARLQVEAGAIGICAAKLSEGEGLLAGGLRNLLLTGPVVTPEAHQRLVRCVSADPGFIITLDQLENAERISRAMVEAGLVVDCLVDLDIGQERTGVLPEVALEFATAISRLPGLRLIGLQAYAGHLQHLISLEERREVNRRAIESAVVVFHRLREEFDLRIFSVGGTGTAEFDVAVPEVTEIQSGSYALMDADYGAVEFGEIRYQTPLTLLTTVLSANRREFATVDAGLKSLYRDGALPVVVEPRGRGFVYDWFGDEYGRIRYAEGEFDCLKVNDRLLLAVSHCDPTVNLFDEFYVIEKGVVVDVWPIDLRGCSQ